MINVVAALISKEGKVLIAKRKTGDKINFEQWEFPGGKVEPDESEQHAIEREIEEELEIKVKANQFLTSNIHEYPNKTVDLKLYDCEYLSGEIKLHDHSEYQWVSPEELLNYNFAPADIPLAKYVKEMKKKLIRFQKYDRKEIHDIFSPNTKFTKQTGSWGLQGIVRVPDTKHDYIFFVTFGKSQSGHRFDEHIDENGILTWQSQPSQGLDSPRIQDFINHDYQKNNIYLFLRLSSEKRYSYMGKLAYLEHDNQREKPVYFKWQILNWNAVDEERIEENPQIDKGEESQNDTELSDFTLNLQEQEINYKKVERKGKKTSEFNNKQYNFEDTARKNTKIGNLGEDEVVAYEKRRLTNLGRADLAIQVMATRNFVGNAERFDVLSFEADGKKRYIEVKTTTGGIHNAFFISENEVSFSEEFSSQYYLYRLYNFNQKEKSADLFIMKGALSRDMLKSTNYECRIGVVNEKN